MELNKTNSLVELFFEKYKEKKELKNQLFLKWLKTDENDFLTWEQVKKRFRELALKFHPDKVKDEEKKTAEEECKKIYEAYETIKTKTGGAA